MKPIFKFVLIGVLALLVGLAVAAVSVSDISPEGLIDAQVSVEAISEPGRVNTAAPLMTVLIIGGSNGSN